VCVCGGQAARCASALCFSPVGRVQGESGLQGPAGCGRGRRGTPGGAHGGAAPRAGSAAVYSCVRAECVRVRKGGRPLRVSALWAGGLKSECALHAWGRVSERVRPPRMPAVGGCAKE